jgi:hypothetical protein
MLSPMSTSRNALPWILALVACGQTFPPASLVTELRVLGIRAEPPEVRPGGETSLTALVADPQGAGREVVIAWGRCEPPGILQDLLACQDTRYITPLGTGPTVTFRVPPDYLETGPAGPGEERLLFVFAVVRAGTEQVIAFKRVNVTSREAPLNRNPLLISAGVRRGDAGVEPVPSVGLNATVRLRADVDPASREKYVDDGTEKTEDLIASWFTTGGSLDLFRTQDPFENTWVAPAEPQTVQFWVVVRDGRGGVDWRPFNLEVR